MFGWHAAKHVNSTNKKLKYQIDGFARNFLQDFESILLSILFNEKVNEALDDQFTFLSSERLLKIKLQYIMFREKIIEFLKNNR